MQAESYRVITIKWNCKNIPSILTVCPDKPPPDCSKYNKFSCFPPSLSTLKWTDSQGIGWDLAETLVEGGEVSLSGFLLTVMRWLPCVPDNGVVERLHRLVWDWASHCEGVNSLHCFVGRSWHWAGILTSPCFWVVARHCNNEKSYQFLLLKTMTRLVYHGSWFNIIFLPSEQQGDGAELRYSEE